MIIVSFFIKSLFKRKDLINFSPSRKMNFIAWRRERVNEFMASSFCIPRSIVHDTKISRDEDDENMHCLVTGGFLLQEFYASAVFKRISLRIRLCRRNFA